MRLARRLLALLAVLAAVSAAGAAAQELPVVKVGLINLISDAPIFIAEKKGYFRAEGVNVQFINFDTAAIMIAPLSTGQLDVGSGGISAGLFNAIGRGLDIRVVADKATDPAGYGYVPLMVRTDLVKSGRFKTLKDIKGMMMADTGKGSGSTADVNALMSKVNMQYDDVRHITLSYPNQVVALKTGSIDAGLLDEPYATQAEKAGYAVRIMNSDGYYPGQQIGIIMYSGAFMRNNRDAALRFMRAYVRGARYYNSALAHGKLAGPTADDVIAILAQSIQISDTSILRQATPNWVDPNVRLNIASMQHDLEFYRSQGLIQSAVTAQGCIDSSIAEEAVQQLGPYKPIRK